MLEKHEAPERHLRERIQLFSRQRDQKLKRITAKRNIPQLTDDEVEAMENQLTSQMNLESRQEVNCTLIEAQNEEDRKDLKRKLWTELVATRNGQETPPYEEGSPGLRPKLVPGDGEQPKLQSKRWISPIRNPQLAGKDAVAGHDPLRHLHPHPRMENDTGSMPKWLPGNTRAKRRRRRKRRREKLRILLHSQGLGPLSGEDPYRHTWDRERGWNSSSSEEEDGLQALTRAWTHQPTPRHSTPLG